MPKQPAKKLAKNINKDGHSDGVYSISAKNWNDLYKYIQKIGNFDDYIWRGQRTTRWKLLPTLYRDIASNTSPDSLLKLANRHLENFKNSCSGRRGPNPKDLNDDNLWWALGQHHGLRTPLLDWARSPFVAAYFAFSEVENDSGVTQRVVYGLNKSLIDAYDFDGQLQFYELYLDENARLLSQNGLFTHCADARGIEAWVKSKFKGDSKNKVLYKIKMPHVQRPEILIALNRMNINSLSLFPDLQGASMFSNWKLDRESELYL